MIQFHIEATIFYRHGPNEVGELAEAIKPMGEHIRAVGSESEQAHLRRVLSGKYFRRSDVLKVKNMLLRAAKHARAHISDYFPTMQDGLVAQAEALEDATEAYHNRFKALAGETIPVN